MGITKTARTTKPAKDWPSLVNFEWQRDALGYDLSGGGKAIVRRGGKLIAYRPDDVEPPLYRIFANLHSQVVTPLRRIMDDTVEYARRDAAFPERKFASIDEALLGFVNEYGFLGSTASGADAREESLDYLHRCLGGLVIFWRATQGGQQYKEAFNQDSPLLRLQVVRGRGGSFRMEFVPESLHAWMWYGVAKAICNQVELSRCLYCEQPMERGPGHRRRHALFCSDKCKTYFHRLPADEKRQRKAAAELARRKGTKP